MGTSALRRSSSLAFLLVGSIQLRTGWAQAQAPEQSHASEIQAAHSAVRRLLDLGQRSESRNGGQIALAQRQADTSSAKSTAAWLDWLPDFSVAMRRQVEQETDTLLRVPRWRLDFEGQIALSLQKFRATTSAQAAQAKAQAELEQAAHTTRERTLNDTFELYFAERRAELVKDQIGTFESLVSGMRQAPRASVTRDDVLVEGYLGELQGKLAELEFERHDVAERLAATLAMPITASGIDRRLELPSLLESIRTAFSGSSARVARVRRADTKLEEERLRWAESQSWYVPELRSTTLALLPQGSAPGSSFRLNSVTTEFALGFRLRPGVPALQSAQRQALAKSRFDDEQSRWLRARTEDQARARLDELSRVWLNDGAIRVASAELADTVQRFARGERSVAELAAASRSLLLAQHRRELVLRDAVKAQITLSTNDRADLARPDQARREELSATEVDQRALRMVERAPLVKSARAEAERASERARSERFLLATAVEAGVLLPIYATSDPSLAVRPELALSGSGSLATVVRETSVLGRWSLDLRATGPVQRAFEGEARLRQVQAGLSRKRYLWAELNARLELAHAQKSVELCQRAAQFALESLDREQRWLQQGATSERDLRAAELAHHGAIIEQGKAEARQREAEILLASHLGEARGTQLLVRETPEALERWASERFLRENGLLGFESVGRRHEAELEAESARAQTEALARPTRGATLTTQATQGLRGGAFSLTFALSVALDPARDVLQVTRAAEREGRARGRLTSLERELDEQRARIQKRLDEASTLLDAEAAIQQRLNVLGDALRDQQAATPDVHSAVKQRQLRSLQAALLESERRVLEADEQRRAALLGTLALAGPVKASPAVSPSAAALEDTVQALTEQRPDVAVADAAANEVRDRQPVPVASGLHSVGPFAVGSYAVNRVVGPSTTKVWRGDIGIGLSLGLDESLAFLGSRQLSTAADLQQGAARRNARLRAIHELGRTWTARELERVSLEEEAEARRHLEGSVEPRFRLGQITSATLIGARQRHAFAQLRRSSDASMLQTQHALLGALGAKVSNAVLDEYQQRASVWISDTDSEPSSRDTGSAPDAEELAARSRSAAAASAATASAFRIASPITALVEYRPAQLETTTGIDELRETTTGHELLWVFSLIVPLKPKELGALAISSAQARESAEELSAATRDARLRRLGLQTRLAALQKERASISARRSSAERALAELDSRLRAALDHATIDEVAKARQALFDARRAEVIAHGAVLEAALLLRAVQENR
jgi:hypothetical protein